MNVGPTYNFFQSTWFLIICCHQSTGRINSQDITCSFLSFGGAGGLIIMSPLSFSIYYWTHINVLTGAAQHKARHHQCLTIMWHLQRNICRQTEDGATNLFWLRDFWWDAERSFSRCWLHHIFISSLTSFLFFMSLMPAESRPGCYLIERKNKCAASCARARFHHDSTDGGHAQGRVCLFSVTFQNKRPL